MKLNNLLNPFYRHQDLNIVCELHAPDPGTGGGGSRKKRRNRDEDEDDDDESRAPRNPTVTAAKYNNDVTAMANHIGNLEDDNYKLRRKNARLKGENEDLQDSLPEGSVVLNKADAAKWEEYKAIGEPKDLKTLKDENVTLKQKTTEFARDAELKKVSDGVEPGIKYDFEVFKDLDGRLVEATYELKTEKVDGQEVKIWYVSYKEGDSKVTKPVHEVFKSKFPKFIPSLVVSANNESDGDLDDGVEFPEQITNDRQSGTPRREVDPVDDFMGQEYGYLLGSKN